MFYVSKGYMDLSTWNKLWERIRTTICETRGKVLCSRRTLALHNEDIENEDIQIQITSNLSGLPAWL